MNEYKGIPRKRLPAGVRTDTLAVREGRRPRPGARTPRRCS